MRHPLLCNVMQLPLTLWSRWCIKWSNMWCTFGPRLDGTKGSSTNVCRVNQPESCLYDVSLERDESATVSIFSVYASTSFSSKKSTIETCEFRSLRTQEKSFSLRESGQALAAGVLNRLDIVINEEIAF